MTEAALSAEHAEPTLRLRGVGRRFGGLLAVNDVDLDVVHGERRAILGPNGAGKTTLFNVICGDLAASTGTVEIFGEDVTKKPARHRAVTTAAFFPGCPRSKRARSTRCFAPEARLSAVARRSVSR